MRELTDLFIDLRSASRTQLLARLVSVGGALLFLAAYAVAGHSGWLGMATLVVLTALATLNPHTLAPGLLIGFAVASWWATVETPWHWALLPAALGLLLVHTGTALSASVPAQAPIPDSVLRTWGERIGVVTAITIGVWGAAGLLALRTGSGLGTIPGIVGLTVLVVALASYVRWRARSTTP